MPAELTPDVLASFQKIIADFSGPRRTVERRLCGDAGGFPKINLELDRKNSELQASLARQEEMQTYLDSILQSMENGVIGSMSAAPLPFQPGRHGDNRFHGKRSAASARMRPFSRATPDGTGTPARTPRRQLRITLERTDNRHQEGIHTVSYHHALLRDRAGEKLGAVEVFSDISKLKALEEEMQQTRTMAALGEMSATVAHEIRNPLGAMGMWAALLERDLADDDPRRSTLGKIVEDFRVSIKSLPISWFLPAR